MRKVLEGSTSVIVEKVERHGKFEHGHYGKFIKAVGKNEKKTPRNLGV